MLYYISSYVIWLLKYRQQRKSHLNPPCLSLIAYHTYRPIPTSIHVCGPSPSISRYMSVHFIAYHSYSPKYACGHNEVHGYRNNLLYHEDHQTNLVGFGVIQDSTIRNRIDMNTSHQDILSHISGPIFQITSR